VTFFSSLYTKIRFATWLPPDPRGEFTALSRPFKWIFREGMGGKGGKERGKRRGKIEGDEGRKGKGNPEGGKP